MNGKSFMALALFKSTKAKRSISSVLACNSAMGSWSTASCKTNGINIHYIRTGGSKPPLVLLHGLISNGACWAPVARILAAEYDLIMPDARGHGKSSVPDFSYRYEDHANDVIGLIKELKLTQPILIGHSMGGLTAALVASRNPTLLSS